MRTLDELREEHARVKARLRVLEAEPGLQRNIASEATRMVMDSLARTKSLGVSAENCELGINYGRWLRRKQIEDDSNREMAQFGFPPVRRIGVFLHEAVGKRVLDEARAVARERHREKHPGAQMMIEREIKDAIEVLHQRIRDARHERR